MTMFLPGMYAVSPSRTSAIMFDSHNSLLQIAVSIALKVGINNARHHFL